ncbi:MAG: hypothetical protein ACP5NV_02680 [Candidatus Woesearchaeota archaeon]
MADTKLSSIAEELFSSSDTKFAFINDTTRFYVWKDSGLLKLTTEEYTYRSRELIMLNKNLNTFFINYVQGKGYNAGGGYWINPCLRHPTEGNFGDQYVSTDEIMKNATFLALAYNTAHLAENSKFVVIPFNSLDEISILEKHPESFADIESKYKQLFGSFPEEAITHITQDLFSGIFGIGQEDLSFKSTLKNSFLKLKSYNPEVLPFIKLPVEISSRNPPMTRLQIAQYERNARITEDQIRYKSSQVALLANQIVGNENF